MKQKSFVMVMVVLIAFWGILFLSDLAGNLFGKRGEIIALVIIIALLAVLLVINNRSGDDPDGRGSGGV